jgi:adenine phosphoribosyltransferase
VATKGKKQQPAQAHLGFALGLDPDRYLRDHIRDVPDFPRKGVLFRDMTPLLADARALALTTDALASRFIGEPLDAIVGIEARGFVFGALLAERLNLGFVPVRRPGKLPRDTDRVSYALDCGQAELHLHRDGVARGSRVLVVDDLLATGGTASAAGELVRRRGGQVSAYVFVVELVGFAGRSALSPTQVYSLIQYE